MNRRLLLLLLTPFASLLPAASARADIIYSADSTSSGIYQYNTTTGGPATLAFSTMGGFLANDLGVNTAGTHFYYSDISGNSGGLYVYDKTTGIQTEFAATGNTNTQLSSGGVFYNGSYYAGILDPTLPYITKYTFAADGTTLLSTTNITPSNYSNLGDFGDFAINPNNGLLYGESQNFNGSGQNVFFSLDPTQSNPFVTVINSSEAGVLQLAFDSQGTLYATLNTNNSFLYTVDVTTGNFSTQVANPFSSAPNDLAGWSLTPALVPEPASVVMVALGLAGVGYVARKRQAAKV